MIPKVANLYLTPDSFIHRPQQGMINNLSGLQRESLSGTLAIVTNHRNYHPHILRVSERLNKTLGIYEPMMKASESKSHRMTSKNWEHQTPQVRPPPPPPHPKEKKIEWEDKIGFPLTMLEHTARTILGIKHYV